MGTKAFDSGKLQDDKVGPRSVSGVAPQPESPVATGPGTRDEGGAGASTPAPPRSSWRNLHELIRNETEAVSRDLRRSRRRGGGELGTQGYIPNSGHRYARPKRASDPTATAALYGGYGARAAASSAADAVRFVRAALEQYPRLTVNDNLGPLVVALLHYAMTVKTAAGARLLAEAARAASMLPLPVNGERLRNEVEREMFLALPPDERAKAVTGLLREVDEGKLESGRALSRRLDVPQKTVSRAISRARSQQE